MNISAKNAARIKIKYIFAIYMDEAYQKCHFFYCRSSGSCEINKKQSGNSFAGHPVITNRDLVQPTMEGRREAQSKLLDTMVGSMVAITMEDTTMGAITMEDSIMVSITMEGSTMGEITMETSTLATITMGAASVTVSAQDHSNAATWLTDINVHSLNTMEKGSGCEFA